MTLIEVLVSMIIAGVVCSMLVMGWINLQKSSAYSLASNTARGDARDAISRISSEMRDCQPNVLPTASPSPTAEPALFVKAASTDARFYSAYNDAGAADEGSGVGVHLTRIWLGLSSPDASNDNYSIVPATSPLRTYLWWRRDTNNNGTFDSHDRTRLLAEDVVNNDPSIAKSIFRYGHLTTGGVTWSGEWNDEVTGSAITAITAVEVRVIVDANLNRPPSAVDLTTTVRLRNTTTN